MRNLPAYLRVILFLTIAYLIAEFFIESEHSSALFNPYVIVFLFLLFLVLVAFESVLAALKKIANHMATPESIAEIEKIRKEKAENHWINKLIRYLFPPKQEKEDQLIIEDHNYDGIQELDNPLPPWWLYLFYGTIIFGVVYLVRYHVFDGSNQLEEYQLKESIAQASIAAYKETAKDFVDASNVVVLTDADALAEGKTLYDTQCSVCHRNDGGGGIGPNLTDAYWILGGDIASIFNTISNGGRPAKGMIAWKSTLKPSQIQAVSSYIVSLKGTQPEHPKQPEGELEE